MSKCKRIVVRSVLVLAFLCPVSAFSQTPAAQETWAGVTTFAADYTPNATLATHFTLEVDGVTDEAAAGSFISGTFIFAPRVITAGVHIVRARTCAKLAGMTPLCSEWTAPLTVTARDAVVPLAPSNLRATVVVVTP